MARDVMFVDQVKDCHFDGTVKFNNSVGFYATAPIAQPAAPGSVVSVSAPISATPYGYSVTQATAIVTTLNAIRAALVALGITAGP